MKVSVVVMIMGRNGTWLFVSDGIEIQCQNCMRSVVVFGDLTGVLHLQVSAFDFGTLPPTPSSRISKLSQPAQALFQPYIYIHIYIYVYI